MLPLVLSLSPAALAREPLGAQLERQLMDETKRDSDAGIHVMSMIEHSDYTNAGQGARL